MDQQYGGDRVKMLDEQGKGHFYRRHVFESTKTMTSYRVPAEMYGRKSYQATVLTQCLFWIVTFLYQEKIGWDVRQILPEGRPHVGDDVPHHRTVDKGKKETNNGRTANRELFQ